MNSYNSTHVKKESDNILKPKTMQVGRSILFDKIHCIVDRSCNNSGLCSFWFFRIYVSEFYWKEKCKNGMGKFIIIKETS